MLSALIFAAVQAAPARYVPVDQCEDDPSFVAFREELRDALDRRDVAGLLPLLSPDIRLNFGGDEGREAFVRHWALTDPGRSGLWREMRIPLGLGCVRTDDHYASPSFLVSLDEDTDVYAAMLVLPGGAVHSAPSDTSPIVAEPTWQLVTLANPEGIEGWRTIHLGDSQTGYVRAEYLRSPIDYRLTFTRRAGRWQVASFLAGD